MKNNLSIGPINSHNEFIKITSYLYEKKYIQNNVHRCIEQAKYIFVGNVSFIPTNVSVKKVYSVSSVLSGRAPIARKITIASEFPKDLKLDK